MSRPKDIKRQLRAMLVEIGLDAEIDHSTPGHMKIMRAGKYLASVSGTPRVPVEHAVKATRRILKRQFGEYCK